MTLHLAVTLGHNASALLYDTETHQTIGYEEERLTRKKNDSSFPINSLKRLYRSSKGRALNSTPSVLVSHWFDNFDPRMSTKYWDSTFFHDKRVISVDHHDAHAWSAIAFYEDHAKLVKPCDVIVIDGFGNDQVCYSWYTYDPIYPGHINNMQRVFGYDASVGLLYQWAAEMCGMDGQADVYKFLGYRTHVNHEILPQLNAAADEIIGTYLLRIDSVSHGFRPNYPRWNSGDLINKDQFTATKESTIAMMKRLIPDWEDRANTGYVVQRVLEEVILYVIDKWVGQHEGRSLLVAGGCFYNVRLNSRIMDQFPQTFCPMPVAGDQGCAFGLIRSRVESPIGLTHSLCVSQRAPWGTSRTVLSSKEASYKRGQESAKKVAALIDEGYIVNLIDGRSMEFGPRALCHTSTLCKPTLENVEIINHLNNRNTVMPMAPVMTRAWAYRLFGERLRKIEGGEKFMITALDYLPGVVEEFGIEGAAHQDLDGSWSGRPQVVDQVDEPFIHSVLTHGGWPCLINTSFNYHGLPICFGIVSVQATHKMWLERCSRNAKFLTVWIE